VTVSGSGITASTDAPAARPIVTVHRHELDEAHSWELRFRRQEQRELAPLVRGGAAGLADGAYLSATSDELRVAVVRTR
jgi:hypothetical protein